MVYRATENAIKIINESKINQFDIEKDLNSSKEKGFSLDNLLRLDVRIDEDGNRYVFAKQGDYKKDGSYKEQKLFEIKYENDEWIKVSKKTD